MNLNDYRGKMGTLVDAGALLRAIEGGAGRDMLVPNVIVAPGKVQTTDLTKYFVDGEKLTCSVSGTNAAVATVKIVDNNQLVVTGVAAGATTATIKAGSYTRTIAITVSKGGGENGWM
jgi:hypothetical protein